MSIFGEIITDTLVENRVRDMLIAWLPDYIPEAARQDGGGAVTLPKSFEVSRSGVNRWEEQALPAIIVQLGGTLRIEQRNGKYRVTYGAAVGAVVAGPTRSDTRRIAGVYSAAITLALTQHGDLKLPGGEPLADGVIWEDTDYDLISNLRSRTLMAAIVSLSITVPDVLDPRQGPAGDPSDNVPSDWPVVESTHLDVTLVPVSDELPED